MNPVIRPLPRTWLDALVKVQNYVPFDPVVIAGGALRDLYLHSTGFLAEMEVKDLDIFVCGSDILGLQDKFGEPTIERNTAPPADSGRSAHFNERLGPAWRWPELEIKGVKVDLVALGNISNVDELLQGFDINLCQVAHDGSYATLHRNFIDGAQEQRIEAVGHWWPERTNQRIDRLAKKFPTFARVYSEGTL